MSNNTFVDAKDYSSIQAALDTGRNVLVTTGTYTITAPLLFNKTSQILRGENPFDTLITSTTAIDLIRMNQSGCVVDNIGLLPFTGGVAIRVYSAWSKITRIRTVSPVNNSGYGIVIQDHTPTGTAVAGAYTHILEDNWLGYSGSAFATTIHVDSPTYGMNACKFINNRVCGDNFIDHAYGGGNLYKGNLFQSSTGTQSVPVGNCIAIGTSVADEQIVGNYFQGYAKGVYSTRTVNTARIFTMYANNMDGVTASSAVQNGITNFIDDRISTGGGSGVTSVESVNVSTGQAIATASLDQTDYWYIRVRGAGAVATGVTVPNGTFSGQILVTAGDSWGVTLSGSNLNYVSSPVLGNGSGQCGSICWKWNTSTSKWDEKDRAVWP